MHVLLSYKLTTKPLEINNQFKGTQIPKTKKNYTKIEKILQKIFAKRYMTFHPHT